MFGGCQGDLRKYKGGTVGQLARRSPKKYTKMETLGCCQRDLRKETVVMIWKTLKESGVVGNMMIVSGNDDQI